MFVEEETKLVGDFTTSTRGRIFRKYNIIVKKQHCINQSYLIT